MCKYFVNTIFFFQEPFAGFFTKNKRDMESNDKPEEHEKEYDEIDEKIKRLQKQNEAESVALKKLLEGLEKIGKPEPGTSKSKKKK